MEVLGVIRVDEMLGVSRTHDDDLLSSSSHKFCFEVITPSRAYLFSADTEDEMISWIDTISQVSSNWCNMKPTISPAEFECFSPSLIHIALRFAYT